MSETQTWKFDAMTEDRLSFSLTNLVFRFKPVANRLWPMWQRSQKMEPAKGKITLTWRRNSRPDNFGIPGSKYAEN